MPTDALGGPITPPVSGSVDPGLPRLISNLINLATIAAGILVLINLLIAGFGFLTAGGDPKKMTDSWARVWRSLLGILLVVAALAIISIVETVLGINILEIKITGPGSLN